MKSLKHEYVKEIDRLIQQSGIAEAKLFCDCGTEVLRLMGISILAILPGTVIESQCPKCKKAYTFRCVPKVEQDGLPLDT